MDILQQLNQIAVERDIPLQELLREIEDSLAVAYKKFVNADGDVGVTVTIDPKGWRAFLQREVVGVITEPRFQMTVTEARKRKPDTVASAADIERDRRRPGLWTGGEGTGPLPRICRPE